MAMSDLSDETLEWAAGSMDSWIGEMAEELLELRRQREEMLAFLRHIEGGPTGQAGRHTLYTRQLDKQRVDRLKQTLTDS